MKSVVSNLLSQSVLAESTQDLELTDLITEITAVFPNWDLQALHGEEPAYTDEVGEEQALVRAKIQSFDEAISLMEAKRKEAYELLQDTCTHNYVAVLSADLTSNYSHDKYDVRICEVCALYENGPGAKYNLYSDLSNAKLGRVLLHHINRDEYRKIEKLTEEIVTV